MHVKIALDLTALDNATLSGTWFLEFNNITNLSNWHEPEENVTALELYNGTNTKEINVFLNDESDPSYTQRDDLYELAEVRDEPLEFECDIPEGQKDNFYTLYSLGIITLIPHENKTLVIAYRLNSERDYIEKTLKFITVIEGSFKAPLGIKNIDLDMYGYDIDNSYNYVFIPRLNRYYYISNILLVTKDYTRLQLQEDVLMSHKVLIKSQSAFISRYEGSTEDKLIDARRPLKDILEVDDITSNITDTPSNNSLVNVTFNYNNYVQNDYPNILVVSLSSKVDVGRTNYLPSPTNSGLPEISSQLNQFEWVNFIKPSKLFYLAKAYLSSDANASYISSALWLPFNPTSAFGLVTSTTRAIYVNDKYIDQYGDYVAYNSTALPLETYQTPISDGRNGVCPYLIIKDFTYSYTGDFTGREPNANYEFYIPFVGWVAVPSYKFFNQRILIYYTMDLKTGLSTAYIYNYNKKVVIWSGTCQIGIKIDLSTTNIEENIRQKQANNLNMIIGLFSSVASIGVGIATENPVAVAGGLMGGAKTITGFVNTNNQIFDRAQMTYGTSNGALYSNNTFKLIKTYHEAITIDLSTYKHLEGLPYNNYVSSMSTLSGYVEVGDIHFDPKGENIYNAEIDEIVGLLKGGVIF